MQAYVCVKADYPRLIREYDKAKKNGSVAKWAEENDIKNPSKRVYSWRQSILKQARKESKQEQNPLFFKMWMKINQNGDEKSII